MDTSNSKKIIEKYIAPKPFTGVLAMLLACAAVVLLLMGIVNSNSGKKVVIEEFYPLESPIGEDAYLDIVGISGWMVKNDSHTWYSAEDEYGYLYVVSVRDSEYKKMQAQIAYWDRDEDEANPEIYRITGLVRNFDRSIERDIADCWEVTLSEFEDYFGDRWLDGKTSAASQSSEGWFAGAFLAGLFAVLIGAGYATPAVMTRKSIKALEEAGLLDRAALQLETEGTWQLGKDRCRITPDFVFVKGSGNAISCRDVLWAYQRNMRYNFVAVNSCLVLETGKRSVVATLGKQDKEGIIGQAIVMLMERNPNLLVGFSGENSKLYRQRKKERKEQQTLN